MDCVLSPHLAGDLPPKRQDENTDHFVERNGLSFAGGHLLLDLWEAQSLTDVDAVRDALCDAAVSAGATVLHAHLHRFGGGGVSGIVVLAESHISIHTWPERQFAAIDIFMCGSCDPYRALAVLRHRFNPRRLTLSEHRRGLTL
jgi:S-adenosylmethionine decarboxylase